MPTFGGIRGTDDWVADERPKNFAEMILWRNPNGTAPVTALLSKVSKESVDDPQFHWWDEPNDLVRLQVNGALTATDTQIVIDSTDPTDVSPDLHYGAATNLTPGDLLLVEPATDAAVFNHEVVEVVAVQSATQFTVIRGASGTTPGVIANDVFLLRIGTAFAEGSGLPTASHRNPQKYFNYTQIFKRIYEITGTASKTRTRTGDPKKNDKQRQMTLYSQDTEMAFLWGQRSETIGTNGKPKRTMGGLRSYINSSTTSILADGWTLFGQGANTLINRVSPVFEFDTEAGDSRMCFVGNGALNAINNAIAAQSGVGAATVNWGADAKMFGMNFRELTFPQGKLMMKTHPLMNRHPLYKNSMFIIDFSSLTYKYIEGRDTMFKDNVQTEDEDVERGRWMGELSLEVAYGGLTNGYIGGFDKTLG